MSDQANSVPFEDLPEDERILITATSKLIKHFRGMESAGLLDKPTTSNLIGCVKRIEGVARERAVRLQNIQVVPVSIS